MRSKITVLLLIVVLEACSILAFPYGEKKIRGVNAGSWLVLERWMNPSDTGVFAGLPESVTDEYTLCEYLGYAEAEQRLKAHWDTWITEAHFEFWARAGLNHVRFPIGYWALDIQPTEPWVNGSWEYVVKAAEWSKKYQLQLMIDLHGAPGSQTQNTVYEIVSDMSSRQDAVEERLSSLEDKMQALQEQLEALPELITRCLTQHQEGVDQRRNFLHPDAAAASTSILPTPALPSPIFIPHSRSEPSATTPSYQWPTSPILPPISSRTPHLVPVTFNPHGAASSSTPSSSTTPATTAAAATTGTMASNSSNVVTNSFTHRQQSS